MRHSRVDVRRCRPAETTYVPEVMAVRPGENVTVYCVINDHGGDASSAVWRFNMSQTIDRSHYRTVNRRVRRPPASPTLSCSTSCLKIIRVSGTGEPDHGSFR